MLLKLYLVFGTSVVVSDGAGLKPPACARDKNILPVVNLPQLASHLVRACNNYVEISVCLFVSVVFLVFCESSNKFQLQVNHKIYQEIVVQPDIMIVAHQCTHEG